MITIESKKVLNKRISKSKYVNTHRSEISTRKTTNCNTFMCNFRNLTYEFVNTNGWHLIGFAIILNGLRWTEMPKSTLLIRWRELKIACTYRWMVRIYLQNCCVWHWSAGALRQNRWVKYQGKQNETIVKWKKKRIKNTLLQNCLFFFFV